MNRAAPLSLSRVGSVATLTQAKPDTKAATVEMKIVVWQNQPNADCPQ